MRQRIGLDDLYAKAVDRAQAALEDGGTVARRFPATCPFALAELLAGDVAGLMVTLGSEAERRSVPR